MRHFDLRFAEPDLAGKVIHFVLIRSHYAGKICVRNRDRLAMLVIVERRTRAFTRHHQRSNRALRRAFPREQFALCRFENALQYFAALSSLGIRDANPWNIESPLSIPLGV